MLTLFILLIPFIFSAFLYFPPFKKEKKVFWSGNIVFGTCLILSTVVISQFFYGNEGISFSFPWLNVSQGLKLNFSFFTDAKGIFLAWTVALLTLVVHNFSYYYLKSHGGNEFRRYIALLALFSGSMMGIIFSYNLIQLFIFWELVGTSSYFLVGFHKEKKSASIGSLKAILYNRLGDVIFFSGILLYGALFGTFDMGILANKELKIPTEIAVLLLVGIMSKSVQIPFQVWLPNAMEGPTPISSLLHAATMVVSGIFFAYRISESLTAEILNFMALIGILTGLIGAISALKNYNLKKILAYSTISQLGIMLFAIGIGASEASYFHLLTHAFFKCSLFLCSGIVLTYLHQIYKNPPPYSEQDIRYMGGLRKTLPRTFIFTILSSAALAGIPFTSGFLSKDLLLANAFSWAIKNGIFGTSLAICLVIINLMTTYYILRFIWYVFLSNFRGVSVKLNGQLEQTEFKEIIGKCTLWAMIPTILGVSLFWSPFSPFSPGKSWIFDWIELRNLAQIFYNISFIVSLFILFAGYGIFYLLHQSFKSGPDVKEKFFPISTSISQLDLNQAFEDLYHILFIKPALRIFNLASWVEKNITDGIVRNIVYLFVEIKIGTINISLSSLAIQAEMIIDSIVNGIGSLLKILGRIFQKLQTGSIQTYLWLGGAILAILVWISLLFR